MPFYEYKCDACGNVFEQRQSFTDPLIEDCPKCGEPVRRVIYPIYAKMAWFTPLHNPDPFDPHPPGYTPGNIREV